MYYVLQINNKSCLYIICYNLKLIENGIIKMERLTTKISINMGVYLKHDLGKCRGREIN